MSYRLTAVHAAGFVAVLLVLCPSKAFGETKYTSTKAHFITESGFLATDFKKLRASDGRALYALQWWEKADKPVRIQVSERDLCADRTCYSQSKGYLSTGNDGNFTSSKSVGVATDHFITGIQVCVNAAVAPGTQKLKGIRLWGARLGSNGNLIHDKYVKEAKRTNCVDWQKERKCGDEEVAVGIKAYHPTFGGFFGIALKCAGVVAVTGKKSAVVSGTVGNNGLSATVTLTNNSTKAWGLLKTVKLGIPGAAGKRCEATATVNKSYEKGKTITATVTAASCTSADIAKDPVCPENFLKCQPKMQVKLEFVGNGSAEHTTKGWITRQTRMKKGKY